MTSATIPSKRAAWFLAARPKTLPAAVSPVLVGTAIAFPTIDAWVLFATFVATILIQIATNFANDYFDFKNGTDTADRIGPQRATSEGWITPDDMRNAFIVTFAMAFAVGCILIWKAGWVLLAIGIASIVCGILYTGGPKPLGYIGLGDLMVFIFFGPVAVMGTVYCHTQTWEPVAFWASVGPAAITTAILVVNNQRDIHTDRATGKMTLVARFGETFGNIEYGLMWVLAALAPVYIAISESKWGVLAATVVALLGLRLTTVFMKTKGQALNPLLPKTAGLLFVYCLAFSIGWVIHG